MQKREYRDFIGVVYHGPHACFLLVRDVFRACHGIDLGDIDAGVETLRAASDKLRQYCLLLADPVSEPREGDVVLIRSGTRPWHIGVVVDSESMLHVYDGEAVCIERFTDPVWRNSVEGFYRHKNLK